MKTRALLLTGLVGCALVGATVMQARSTGVGQHAVAPATAAPVGREIAAEGRVVTYPGGEVKMGAERSGRLVRVNVEERRRVQKGDVLAEMESDELRAALAEARARVAEAEAEIRLAESSLRRRQQLVEQQILAVHDLDAARRDVEIALARRETARAEAERHIAQIRKTRILAPIAGTVTGRHVDAGETVETGDALFTVADLTRLRVEAEADEADAASLALGAPVSISADSYPGQQFEGRIEEVADAVTLRRLKPQDPARPTDARILAIKVAFVGQAPLKLGSTVELKIGSPR